MTKKTFKRQIPSCGCAIEKERQNHTLAFMFSFFTICLLLITACSFTGCARLNGYKTTNSQLASRIIENPTERLTVPSWKTTLEQKGNENFLMASLVRERTIERVEVTETEKKIQKVYLNNDRFMELFSLALFIHDFGLMSILDLFPKLVGLDGGIGHPPYEKERPNYFIRLGHWVGWWTFAYPVYDVDSRKEVRDWKREVSKNERPLEAIAQSEWVADVKSTVILKKLGGQEIKRGEFVTSVNGPIPIDLHSLLAAEPEQEVREVMLLSRDANGTEQKWNGEFVRIASPPFVIPEKELASYIEERDAKARAVIEKAKEEKDQREAQAREAVRLKEEERKGEELRAKEVAARQEAEKKAKEERERQEQEIAMHWKELSEKATAFEEQGELEKAVAVLKEAQTMSLGGVDPKKRIEAIHAKPEWKKSLPRVCIQKFDIADGVSPGLSKFCYDALLEAITNSPNLVVVDWEEIDRILKYISTSQPNLSPEEARKQAVSQLGISRMFLGSVTKVGTKYYVTVKILGLDLSIIKAVQDTATQEEDLANVIAAMAKTLF